ncbi:hypothetical protein AB3331_04510 [Streptococcus sp. H49]|uniref:hypothetical protein n=1 Tax=Streptococcus huangxiaojuni TaxID=3237239 RepID=UPI0034A3EE41
MYDIITAHKRNWLKMVVSGMSDLILPIAFLKQDIAKVQAGMLSDTQKLKRDYAKSVKEINEEALKFAYREKR